MDWGYRVATSTGVGLLAALTVLVANLGPVQAAFTTYVPVAWRLEPQVMTGGGRILAMCLVAGVVTASLLPLYKRRSMRLLDLVFASQKRLVLAGFALATLGYYDRTFEIPRPVLTLSMALLLVGVPLWFAWMRLPGTTGSQRAVLVGDDPEHLAELADTSDLDFIGAICPTAAASGRTTLPDGGRTVDRIAGLSRVEEALTEYDVDTAVLAFREPDREDFFGTLDVCAANGLRVKVHRRFADAVLTTAEGDLLVDVDLEPWDVQDAITKRLFDIAFATTALIALAPLMALIAVAIKLDDGGPVFYRQFRTAGFGGPFEIFKFRTMTAEGTPAPGEEADRVTRIGRWLRSTHFDETPQLWAILTGKMSVVGPRPVWIEEEDVIEMAGWRQRWFIKPGLTGLAQVAEVGSEEPAEKLRLDLAYIRRQSIWLDLKIVIRQMLQVVRDAWRTVRSRRRGFPTDFDP